MLTPDRCTECDLEPGPCTSCQLRTALADVEAMRAAVLAAEQLASCDLSFFNNSIVYYANKLRDALRALDARATDSHRCPGCNAEHRGEYDHCEPCRARIATPSGGKGRTR